MTSAFQNADLPPSPSPGDLPLDFYLLGQVDFDRVVNLQRRLAYEVGDIRHPRLVVLLCEHGELITVGRQGSRAHIRYGNEQLRRMGVKVEWVGRGGGCIPHGRGQLAIYPVVALPLVGWTIGEYLRRLQTGIRAAIEQFNVHTSVRDRVFGIWGHSGLLAAVGVAVRNWTTSHGVYLNVNPSMNLFHHVDTGAACVHDVPESPPEKSNMSSLLAERRVAVTMSSVRTAVIDGLAKSFGCAQVHVHAAHPSLCHPQGLAGESCANV
jgi:lipoyl(octanoyl) transferase